MVRILRSRSDYERALARVSELLSGSHTTGSPERDELELLAVLVEEYERKARPVLPPDPVDAIMFRLDQLGLKQSNLVPLLGARSRVSEILARKRSLTLEMMRALNEHLGIPWESLTAPQQVFSDESFWGTLPTAAMRARGWITTGVRAGKKEIRAAVNDFFAPIGGPEGALALYRRSHARVGKQSPSPALMAWTARLISLATRIEAASALPRFAVAEDQLIELVRLSQTTDGPMRAYSWLRAHGIVLLCLQHLPGTQLDGAALALASGRGVIGVTCRYDRLDNFWFTLLHECIHLIRHVRDSAPNAPRQYLDDLDVASANDPRESEADAVAGELLIPQAAWDASVVRDIAAPPTVHQLAGEIQVHPAIVAGRVRRERGDYRILTGMIGQGEVRSQLMSIQPEYVR